MNYEFKGTPGPWRWEINPKSKSIMLCGGKPLYDLTVVGFERWGMQGATPLFLDANQMMHPAIDYSVDHPERKHHSSWFKLVDHPDANLIAAAPDLLQVAINALSDLKNLLPESDARDARISQIEAVLSKALNQQP